MSIVTPVPTSVYKYYDHNNLLLYIGITSRGIARNAEHNATKEWWPFVARQEVEHHPHRLAASERERHLIHKFRPPFNTQHNPFHEEMRAIYLASVAGRAMEKTPRTARQLLCDLRHRLPLTIVDRERTEVTMACDPAHHELAEALQWDRPVLILAPKKVARLVSIDAEGAHVLYGFKSDQRIPNLEEPTMRVKMKMAKPLILRIHEVRAEVAA